MCLKKRNTIFPSITLGFVYLISSCAPSPTGRKAPGLIQERPAEIQSVRVIPVPPDGATTIEIATSKRVPYTAFKLARPLRLIADIAAVPAEGLSQLDVVKDPIIKAIHFERMRDRPTRTRIIARLSQDIEYDVQAREGTIEVRLFATKPVEKVQTRPTGPRLFFSPGKTKLNQLLGIDFFMLPEGKSGIIVTTSKEAEYELSRRNSLTLLLHIKEATIPRELARVIDSSYFKGAVTQITPIVKGAERRVALEIELREMVPYNLVQSGTEIRLDFNKTSVKPPAKRITPERLGKALEKPGKLPEGVISPVGLPRLPLPKPDERYTGARMTLEFVNADIRDILKLIAEISKRNIVWGPEVKGTVSMRLKDVPWDQALAIVLEANDLGMTVK